MIFPPETVVLVCKERLPRLDVCAAVATVLSSTLLGSKGPPRTFASARTCRELKSVV